MHIGFFIILDNGELKLFKSRVLVVPTFSLEWVMWLSFNSFVVSTECPAGF